ncbi:MAG: DUF4920 domain-containing protein [Robiginitalea sp.]
MKLFNISLVFLLLVSACKEAKKQSSEPLQQAETPAFTTAGAPISEGNVFSEVEMSKVYSDLQPGDTLTTRFEGEVVSVCQMKGCWMRVEMPGEETVMVRFKDYGFFVPKDISGKRVMVEGKAFVSEVDEAERRHMAEDAGKPDSLIAKISGSQMQKGFEASGVRIFR